MTTAERILSYGPRDAGKLFDGDAKNIKKHFRKLAASWHPDRCNDPQAASVFQRIMELRDAALNGPGTAQKEQMVSFMARTGKPFRARVITSSVTDYGKVYIGPRSLSYEYAPDLDDIAKIERSRIESFRFADPAMKEEMSRALPTLLAHAELEDHAALNIIERPQGEVLLSDLVDRLGPLPDVHAAWVGSGLMNIACYLEWAGLVHGAIAMDTVLVNPETHSVRLTGGWGFSVHEGQRFDMLPNRTLDVIPAVAINGYKASHSVDLELIRRTLREALGDPSGSRLKAIGVPDFLAMFLIMPPAETAIKDYKQWQDTLHRTWGARRFVTFNGTAADVYGVPAHTS